MVDRVMLGIAVALLCLLVGVLVVIKLQAWNECRAAGFSRVACSAMVR